MSTGSALGMGQDKPHPQLFRYSSGTCTRILRDKLLTNSNKKKNFFKLIIIIETERICYKHFKGSPKLGKIKKNLSSRFGKKSRGKEIVV